MAVQRLSLSDITTELRRIVGEATPANSAVTDAQIATIVNGYGQRLATRCAQIANRQASYPRFDMWRTDGTLTCTQGSATVHFPSDYDSYIEFYNSTDRRPIYPAARLSSYAYTTLKHKAPGPPEVIEILDFVSSLSVWRRRGIIYPTPPASVTPSISLLYHRLPAVMPNSAPTSEYPDADPKYHWLWVYGPATELLRPTDSTYSRFQELEKELLKELAASATWSNAR